VDRLPNMTFCGLARDTVLTNRQTEKLNFDTNYITILLIHLSSFSWRSYTRTTCSKAGMTSFGTSLLGKEKLSIFAAQQANKTFKENVRTWPYHQAFSQKGVQASWDAPRTKSGRLWMPKFWGKRVIIFNDFPKCINISERN
jgi:hypothetical protein